MSTTDNAAQGHSADLNEPAFPFRDGMQEYQFGGMSLRDYFAAKVIGHLVALESRQECTVEDDVRMAFKYADEMLAARTGSRDE